MQPETKEITRRFLITRVAIVLLGVFSSFIILQNQWFGEPQSILDLFIRWDSNWYLGIASEGYFYTPGEQSSIAFFPLYPLLIKLFSLTLLNPKIVGLLISNIAFLAGAIYLFKLVMLETKDRELASKTVWYLFIFPVSFFFSLVYTEGLFLLLAASSFYYARKQKWLL
jgi:Gpi18-like mannosyltransferase